MSQASVVYAKLISSFARLTSKQSVCSFSSSVYFYLKLAKIKWPEMGEIAAVFLVILGVAAADVSQLMPGLKAGQVRETSLNSLCHTELSYSHIWRTD